SADAIVHGRRLNDPGSTLDAVNWKGAVARVRIARPAVRRVRDGGRRSVGARDAREQVGPLPGVLPPVDVNLSSDQRDDVLLAVAVDVPHLELLEVAVGVVAIVVDLQRSLLPRARLERPRREGEKRAAGAHQKISLSVQIAVDGAKRNRVAQSERHGWRRYPG